MQERKREGNVAREVHRYDKAMHDISQSERTVYGEGRNGWKEDDSSMEALCKVISPIHFLVIKDLEIHRLLKLGTGLLQFIDSLRE